MLAGDSHCCASWNSESSLRPFRRLQRLSLVSFKPLLPKAQQRQRQTTSRIDEKSKPDGPLEFDRQNKTKNPSEELQRSLHLLPAIVRFT